MKITGLRSPVYPEMGRMYSKSNCKKCYGRGVLQYDDPTAKTSWAEYCTCAKRNMKKYGAAKIERPEEDTGGGIILPGQE